MTTTYKVSAFKTAQGHVTGHQIVRHSYDWMKGDHIKHVVFETFDNDAAMTVEVLVHWTNWTRYMKCKWPKGGSIKAVLLESGRRIHASSRAVGYYDNDCYLRAPLICRDTFIIVGLNSEQPLLEVDGVGKWVYSKRRPEDTARLLACQQDIENQNFLDRSEPLVAMSVPTDPSEPNGSTSRAAGDAFQTYWEAVLLAVVTLSTEQGEPMTMDGRWSSQVREYFAKGIDPAKCAQDYIDYVLAHD